MVAGLQKKKTTQILSCILCTEGVGFSLGCVFFFNYYFFKTDFLSCLSCLQNVMPLSAGLFKSERKNSIAQCPPRLHVQFLTPVSWSRVPNHFLKVHLCISIFIAQWSSYYRDYCKFQFD